MRAEPGAFWLMKVLSVYYSVKMIFCWFCNLRKVKGRELSSWRGIAFLLVGVCVRLSVSPSLFPQIVDHHLPFFELLHLEPALAFTMAAPRGHLVPSGFIATCPSVMHGKRRLWLSMSVQAVGKQLKLH